MLIGLTGKMGSGKDTACELIQSELDFERRSFAERLKVSAARALGYDGDLEACVDFCNKLKNMGEIDIWLDSVQPICISGREYLQWYGTEAHRNVFGQDFWIDAVLPRTHVQENIIVTDVRFENEAQRIRECGGVVWEIVRGEDKGDQHASEQRLPEELIDKTFRNDGTFEELKSQLLEAIANHEQVVRVG